MKHIEEAYLDLVREILSKEETHSRGDRTGTGTISVFARVLKHDLANGFPLFTHKHVSLKAIAAELIWFLSGSTNIKPLKEMGCNIWDEWADEDGELGPIYGYQWRQREGGDQIMALAGQLVHNPESRRMYVSAWDSDKVPVPRLPPNKQAEIGHQALPACHHGFQSYVTNDGCLDMMVHIRSSDVLLGCPYNIASYALLNHLLCRFFNLTPGVMTYTLGDTHIYNNHIQPVVVSGILDKTPESLPTLHLTDYFKPISDDSITEFDTYFKDNMHFTLEQVCKSLKGYGKYSRLDLPVAV